VVWWDAGVDGFLLLRPLFSSSFFVTVAAGEVGVMCEAWLAGDVRGGEKLSILFMIFSICLLASSFTRGILTATFPTLLVLLHSGKIGKTW